MTDDEEAIRRVVDKWMAATRNGDLEIILGLMTDDVIFMAPGREPFGKEAFKEAFKGMAGMRIEGDSEIVELQVLGDWAFTRNRITMTVFPPDGSTVRHSGYTLTLLCKGVEGSWRLMRDANLVGAT